MIRKTITRRALKAGATLPDTLHPVLRRVYAARQVESAEELDYSLDNLLPFNLLSNIDAAASLLASTLQQNKRMVIVADYDADGATACALAMRGLTAMGARELRFIVPDRFEHGYGLSPDVVELAAALEPDLIITVDNGISSVEGVALARSKAIDVLITDHHLPGPELPEANVIVNPNLANDRFPGKSLAGVGVMFYVLAALRAELRAAGWFEQATRKEPNLAALLDLVALGTVADVVALDRNNRILVAQGLERIRQGKCAAGISALLAVAGRSPENTVASDLGFAIAPRLNAAGRLTDMGLGIECLLCDDRHRAREMALQLDRLNKERREIQAEMEGEALADIERMNLHASDALPDGMCLYQAHWHQGVIGILASRIKEQVHRPVIAFAADGEDLLKGSARSIPAIHIRDVIEAIATANPGLVLKYGGHAMAAGLTLSKDRFASFCELFDSAIRQQIQAKGYDSQLMSDGELAADEINIELAQQVRQAGPWGQGFPEPQFDGRFRILSSRVVGNGHLKLRLCLGDDNNPVDAIAFNVTDELWPDGCEQVEALYRLDVNEYRGRRSAQLVLEYIEPLVSRP